MASISTIIIMSVTVYCVWSIRLIDHDSIQEMADVLPCGTPQPRAFHISELTHEALEFTDSFVVLNRCGHSGCCFSERERCEPLETEKVNLTLEYYDDYSNFLHVIAEDHKSCYCSSNNVSIK